jgi:4-diphosphocytidyl-2C-methyl-D-erythritol kinase
LGIGEVIEPLEDVSLNFVVVTPAFPVSTRDVYDTYDAMGAPALEGDNDLEPAALVVEPRLAEVRRAIATVVHRTPTLAGSGASYFLECSSAERADLAEALRASLKELIGPVVVSPCRAVARESS